MTRLEHDTAMSERLTRCGFRPLGGDVWHIPGGGELRAESKGIALTRDSWCCESYWRTMGVTRASVPALHALYLATRDLPERYGHETLTYQAVHVPGPTGFGSGARDDTGGT